jgi:phenylacetate-coenzyme A ligase PaaK-like adenylate-forming protein
MRFDLSGTQLRPKAFSGNPMTFLAPQTRNVLSTIMEITALETGDPEAREIWQAIQIQNLLTHAARRSAFWRQRIGTASVNNVQLSTVPSLTRGDVIKQVQNEGCLLRPADQMKVASHSTSGSSGIPLKFFVSEFNGFYQDSRYFAQYFIENRDLNQNRTRFKVETRQPANGFVVEKSKLGPISEALNCGINKKIGFLRPDMRLLRKELQTDSIGYLVASPKTMEILLQDLDVDFFKGAGTLMWIPFAEATDDRLREQFVSVGINVRANYSSEEVGPIGFECDAYPGFYHVASSNVHVEVAAETQAEFFANKVGRVLITHLHSYATPFIRYDIGDLASYHERCPCGHNGPTLSNVYGRTKGLVKHPDGRLSVFFVRGSELKSIADFDEYRIRQVSLQKIIVEIGGRETLNAEEIAGFVKFVNERAGSGFEVEVKAVKEITWGKNVKRLGFHNELL